ncbi:MAG: copper homeostasis protein CutC [Kiritimatiellia bacterium]
MMSLEICIDSPASARAAALGGADRVELCDNLPDGGTTPSLGMIRAVRAAFPRKLMVIIRPRGGDFLFDADETAAMLHDVRAARDAWADGVVIGCLRADGAVDREACARLVEAAGPLDLTYRAFDMEPRPAGGPRGRGRPRHPPHPHSGGAPDVPAGLDAITRLVRLAGDRVSLMPGGGVTPANIGSIVRAAGVREAAPQRPLRPAECHALPQRVVFHGRLHPRPRVRDQDRRPRQGPRRPRRAGRRPGLGRHAPRHRRHPHRERNLLAAALDAGGFHRHARRGDARALSLPVVARFRGDPARAPRPLPVPCREGWCAGPITRR